MLAEHSVSVDHSTIYRRVQRYALEMEKRLCWYWRHQDCQTVSGLFLSEGKRITDVAAQTGYASLSALAKVFTRLIGLSSTQYCTHQKDN